MDDNKWVFVVVAAMVFTVGLVFLTANITGNAIATNLRTTVATTTVQAPAGGSTDGGYVPAGGTGGRGGADPGSFASEKEYYRWVAFNEPAPTRSFTAEAGRSCTPINEQTISSNAGQIVNLSGGCWYIEPQNLIVGDVVFELHDGAKLYGKYNGIQTEIHVGSMWCRRPGANPPFDDGADTLFKVKGYSYMQDIKIIYDEGSEDISPIYLYDHAVLNSSEVIGYEWGNNGKGIQAFNDARLYNVKVSQVSPDPAAFLLMDDVIAYNCTAQNNHGDGFKLYDDGIARGSKAMYNKVSGFVLDDKASVHSYNLGNQHFESIAEGNTQNGFVLYDRGIVAFATVNGKAIKNGGHGFLLYGRTMATGNASQNNQDGFHLCDVNGEDRDREHEDIVCEARVDYSTAENNGGNGFALYRRSQVKNSYSYSNDQHGFKLHYSSYVDKSNATLNSKEGFYLSNENYQGNGIVHPTVNNSNAIDNYGGGFNLQDYSKADNCLAMDLNSPSPAHGFTVWDNAKVYNSVAKQFTSGAKCGFELRETGKIYNSRSENNYDGFCLYGHSILENSVAIGNNNYGIWLNEHNTELKGDNNKACGNGALNFRTQSKIVSSAKVQAKENLNEDMSKWIVCDDQSCQATGINFQVCTYEDSCSETGDSGNNPNMKGTVTGYKSGEGQYSHTDSCFGAGQITEYYCNGNTYATATSSCPSGCNNGACFTGSASCSDTDSGDDPYWWGNIYGVTANGQSFSFSDSCVPPTPGTGEYAQQLTEYTCVNNQMTIKQYRCYQCANNGAGSPNSCSPK
ncbi:MAG: hypothetical protein ACP5N3_06215 [Candidatus Nanoarchaeia archaeon]